MALCKECDKNYRIPKEKYCPECLVRILRIQNNDLKLQVKELKQTIKDESKVIHATGY